MSERAITRRILRDLNNAPGCKAIKIMGGRWMETGTFDIIGCYRGLFFAIEVKTPHNAASRIQTQRLWEWHEAGGTTVVATTDFPVDQFLKGLSGKEN